MKPLILFIGLFFISEKFYGQKCKISNLSKEDKSLLQSFWNDFKQSINTNDTAKLISLCKFPFYCSYCQKTKIKSSSDVIKSSFFFAKNFKAQINTHKSPEDYFILHGDFGTKQRSCSYVFYYTEQNGHVIFFNVTKIGNSYKLTSTWGEN